MRSVERTLFVARILRVADLRKVRGVLPVPVSAKQTSSNVLQPGGTASIVIVIISSPVKD